MLHQTVTTISSLQTVLNRWVWQLQLCTEDLNKTKKQLNVMCQCHLFILFFFLVLKFNLIFLFLSLLSLVLKEASYDELFPRLSVDYYKLRVSNVKLCCWAILPMTNLINSCSLQNGKTQTCPQFCTSVNSVFK